MFPLSASARQGLRPATALLQHVQCWVGGTAAAARRPLSSTPSDEFNREMAELFGGGGGGALGPQRPAPSPSAAASSATATAAVATAAAEGGLLGDVQEFNAELFGVMGAPPDPQQQAAAGPSQAQQQLGAAAQLAAAATAAAATPAQRHASGSSGMTSSSAAGSFASGPASSSLAGGGGGGEVGARLTHVDASGRATMVDVSHKRDTVRSATAGARVLLGPDVFRLVASNQVGKGDVLTVAQLAGVMGAKQTAALIPLCHNISLSSVRVRLALVPADAAVDVTAEATTVGPTGVEMEALTAAAVAALTVYDMCKAASKGIEVTGLRLLRKSGGKSGDWVRGGEGGGGGGGEGDGGGAAADS